MFKRKIVQSNAVNEADKVSTIPEAARGKSSQDKAMELSSAWNSWGDRNPLALGSFGRW